MWGSGPINKCGAFLVYLKKWLGVGLSVIVILAFITTLLPPPQLKRLCRHHYQGIRMVNKGLDLTKEEVPASHLFLRQEGGSPSSPIELIDREIRHDRPSNSQCGVFRSAHNANEQDHSRYHYQNSHHSSQHHTANGRFISWHPIRKGGVCLRRVGTVRKVGCIAFI